MTVADKKGKTSKNLATFVDNLSFLHSLTYFWSLIDSNLKKTVKNRATYLIFPDSWVDLGGPMTTTTSPISLSGAVTPTRRLMSNNPFGGEHDYLRMLREAQRESNRSSSKVSPISSAFISGKNTPSGS